MSVEHILAREAKTEFQDAALGLHLADRVGEFGRRQAGAGRVVVKQVGVQVKGIDRIVFQYVDQVNADELADLDPDGMAVVIERDVFTA